MIAWTFAGVYPSLLDQLVICNAPHMAIYAREAKWPRQLRRSWYVLFFQLPRLPELALAARDFRAVRRMFREMPSRPDTFSDRDIDRYVEALARPGALTAALNFYRANVGSGMLLARSARSRADTLVLWGERDPALVPSLLNGLDRVAPRLTVRRFPDASHWIQNEAPAAVNAALIAFLRRPPAA